MSDVSEGRARTVTRVSMDVCACVWDSAVTAWRAAGCEVSNVSFCVSLKGSHVALC